MNLLDSSLAMMLCNGIRKEDNVYLFININSTHNGDVLRGLHVCYEFIIQ